MSGCKATSVNLYSGIGWPRVFLLFIINAAWAAEPLPSELTRIPPANTETSHIETSRIQSLNHSPLKSAQLKVVVPRWGLAENQQNSYFFKLLTLAFVKTEMTDGVVDIDIYGENLSGARVLADLKNNTSVDVIWTGTNQQRERELRPVYISLLNELNDYRVLLIRAEDQPAFTAVQSLDDLRKFTAGSGADWPSTDILRFNDLPVLKVNNTHLLFSMLKAKRFDYMSRNLFEVWDEAKTFSKDGLVVENTILLRGGVPFYFFVNKDNKKLAARIERGLRIAIVDGSFDALFSSTPGFSRGRAEIQSQKRKVLTLEQK